MCLCAFVCVCVFVCVRVCEKDTEAAVRDLQVPEVDSEVVRGDEGLQVGVDGDGVDVVGVSVTEHPSGCGLNHQVHG